MILKGSFFHHSKNSMTCHKSIHATALNESETNKPPVGGKSRNFQTLSRLLILGGLNIVLYGEALHEVQPLTLSFDDKNGKSFVH